MIKEFSENSTCKRL